MDDNVVSLRRRKKPKGKGPFVLGVLVILILLLGVLYLILGQSRIRYITVVGSYHYSKEEIIEMVGIDESTTVMDIFMKRNQSYSLLPYVEDVTLSYDSFNSLLIEVDEKDVTSYIPFQNQYLALDKDGFIVGYEREKAMNLPSVRGLDIDSAVIGKQVDVDPMVLSVLLEMFHLIGKYSVPLTDIEFVNGNGTRIQCVADDVVIVFGAGTELDRKMRSTKEVLSRLDPDASGTLDLQVDSDRYIFKENLGIEIYVSDGDLFYALNGQREVVKIGRSRLFDLPLINGIVFGETAEVVLKTRLPVEEEDWLLYEKVIAAFEYRSLMPVTLEVSEREFEVFWGNVQFLIGDGVAVDERLALAMPLVETLKSGESGTIDLRESLEVYTFDRNED